MEASAMYPEELQKIQAFFQQHTEVAVAFSGGVDSAVLLLLASRYAKRLKAYYVKTQFQPQFELEDAQKIAAYLKTDMIILSLDVLSDAQIAANPENRCYYCKRKIFSCIAESAAADGVQTVLDGTNASDDIADRPGYRALQELGVLSPLKLCGYTKVMIRSIAAAHGLFVADKPSYACLATRIPYLTPVTVALLDTTQRAEDALRTRGFRNFRIRYRSGDAVIELGQAEFERFFARRTELYSLLAPYYRHIFLDLKERTDE